MTTIFDNLTSWATKHGFTTTEEEATETTPRVLNLHTPNTDGKDTLFAHLVESSTAPNGAELAFLYNTDQANIWLNETRPDFTQQKAFAAFKELSTITGREVRITEWIDPEDWDVMEGDTEALDYWRGPEEYNPVRYEQQSRARQAYYRHHRAQLTEHLTSLYTGAGVQFDPQDMEDLAAAIIEGTSSPDERLEELLTELNTIEGVQRKFADLLFYLHLHAHKSYGEQHFLDQNPAAMQEASGFNLVNADNKIVAKREGGYRPIREFIAGEYLLDYVRYARTGLPVAA